MFFLVFTFFVPFLRQGILPDRVPQRGHIGRVAFSACVNAASLSVVAVVVAGSNDPLLLSVLISKLLTDNLRHRHTLPYPVCPLASRWPVRLQRLLGLVLHVVDAALTAGGAARFAARSLCFVVFPPIGVNSLIFYRSFDYSKGPPHKRSNSAGLGAAAALMLYSLSF